MSCGEGIRLPLSQLQGEPVSFQIGQLKGSLRSKIFFSWPRIFPPGVIGSGSHPPTLQNVWFGLCLVIDPAGETFGNNSMWVFLTMAPPCALGEESQESRFLAEDVMSTWACVWEEMGCQALGGSLEHWDYLCILKKLRPNFSKWWLFFSQPRYTHSFRFWPGSFSLVAANTTAQLSKWERISSLEPALRSLGIRGGEFGWLLWLLAEAGDPLCGCRSCHHRRAWVETSSLMAFVWVWVYFSHPYPLPVWVCIL